MFNTINNDHSIIHYDHDYDLSSRHISYIVNNINNRQYGRTTFVDPEIFDIIDANSDRLRAAGYTIQAAYSIGRQLALEGTHINEFIRHLPPSRRQRRSQQQSPEPVVSQSPQSSSSTPQPPPEPVVVVLPLSKKEEECSVCLDRHITHQLGCKHSFCLQCVNELERRHHSCCPMCRQRITSKTRINFMA